MRYKEERLETGGTRAPLLTLKMVKGGRLEPRNESGL